MSENVYLSLYFNDLSEKSNCEHKKSHYDFVKQLLSDTDKVIDSIEKFESLLKNGGYKNPRGLLVHYRKHEKLFEVFNEMCQLIAKNDETLEDLKTFD